MIVSDVGKLLKENTWTPAAFSKDFGEKKVDLINCLNGKIVPNQFFKKFWDGFETASSKYWFIKKNYMKYR